MLHVILPVTFVGGSSLDMNEDAIAIRLVVFPLPLVVIAIGMRELALSLGLVVAPLALVHGSIRPLLPTSTVSHVAQPLSLVLDPIFKPLQRFFLSLDPPDRLCLFGDCRVYRVTLKRVVVGVHFRSLIVLIHNQDIMLLLLGQHLILRGTHLHRIQLLFVDQLVLFLLVKLGPKGLGDVVAEIRTLGVAHLIIIYCSKELYLLGGILLTAWISLGFIGKDFSGKL